MAKELQVRAMPMQEVDGPFRTYCACFTNLNVGTAATTAIATLTGVAGKVIRVSQVQLGGTISSAAAHFDVQIQTQSTVNSGGTPVALTAVSQDTNDPAASAVAQGWTAGPTLGTVVGASANAKLFIPVPGAALNNNIQFNFGFGAGAKALTLRSALQSMAVTLNGATPANASQFDGYIIWTESDF